MIEIRSILAPTDFSKHAEAAVRYACSLAETLGARLHLLHVLVDFEQPVGPDPMLMTVLPPEFYVESERASHEALKTLLQPSWGRPSSVVTAVGGGTPSEVIVEYAKAHAVDLIVIATHGRTGLSHILLGSVAERIIREASCPVLTIRERSAS